MPIQRDFDSDRAIWCLTTAEQFDLEDIVELLEKNDWRGGKRFLWDLRDLRSGPSTTPEIKDAAGLIEKTQQIWAGSRAAIVVSRDVDFGIARMFQVYAEQIDVTYEIFRERETAIAWLLGDASA